MRRGPAITAFFEASVSPYRPSIVPVDEFGGQSTCIVSEWVVAIPSQRCGMHRCMITPRWPVAVPHALVDMVLSLIKIDFEPRKKKEW
jgi:hypothetical protein